tara:strand:- start:116 stop:1429 length:1314 start_codon:yes stop_codon:yes gene_type:complete
MDPLTEEEEEQRFLSLRFETEMEQNTIQESLLNDDDFIPFQANVSDAILNFTNYRPNLSINIPSPIPLNESASPTTVIPNNFITPPTSPHPTNDFTNISMDISGNNISDGENNEEQYSSDYDDDDDDDDDEELYAIEQDDEEEIPEIIQGRENPSSNIPYFPSIYQDSNQETSSPRSQQNDTSNVDESKYIEKRDCSVCYKSLDTHRMVCTPCNHTYCVDCFFKWLKESKTCAMCRSNLVDYSRWEYDELPRRTSEEFKTFRRIFKNNRELTSKNFIIEQQLNAASDLLKSSLDDIIRRKEQGEYTSGYNAASFELLSPHKLDEVNNMSDYCPYKRGFMRGFYERNNSNFKVFYSKNRKNFVVNESKKKRKIYIRKHRCEIPNTLFGYGFTKRIYTNEFLLNTIKDENGRVKTYKRNVYKDQNGIKHIETIEESTIL